MGGGGVGRGIVGTRKKGGRYREVLRAGVVTLFVGEHLFRGTHICSLKVMVDL